MKWSYASITALHGTAVINAALLSNAHFHIEIDDYTGALTDISNPVANHSINWLSSPSNAPWLPPGSLWGLGYADLGSSFLHRGFWGKPDTSTATDRVFQATYLIGPLQLSVTRTLDDLKQSFTERYSFKNNGNTTLNLASSSNTSLAIYAPFNDDYTNSTDCIQNRAHTHIWANGGSSAWVKQTQMGGYGPHLGLVVTKGALLGYSVESRNRVTGSNTRGVFLLHPVVPVLGIGEVSSLEWTMFWHKNWADFFAQSASRSSQFIQFNVSSYTVSLGENVTIGLSGSNVNNKTTVNNQTVQDADSTHQVVLSPTGLGQQLVSVTTIDDEGQRLDSSLVINVIPPYRAVIANRTRFIADKQQITSNISISYGAYAVYDNEMEGLVTFDKVNDHNTARERVGMGVLMARWLKENPDPELTQSLLQYYEYVVSRLQDDNGYVYDYPKGSNLGKKRLYNWPWVMQLHLTMAALQPKLTGSVAAKPPLERFMSTLQNFYDEGGATFYPIGLPALEGLRALRRSANTTAYDTALRLMSTHAENIARVGVGYPASEVNYEQSIVAPAAIFLLELYRATGNDTWLQAAEPHFQLLLHFGGQQPDYRVFDISIRHWDAYWFGKDEMWGDTFPHYWSTLTAIAMHHYSKATGQAMFQKRSESIFYSNLALFTPDGRGSCALIYPLSVNGRYGQYKDPYANDQDWALAHMLQIEQDNAESACRRQV